jgi:hypothetical protein
VSIGDLRPEECVVDGVVSHRYRGRFADHAVIIQRGAKSRRDAVHRFCAYHASRGAEVWVIETPLNSVSDAAERVPTPVALGNFVVRTTELPVFILGLHERARDVDRALHDFDVFWGAILVKSPVEPATSDGATLILSVLAEADSSVGQTEEVRIPLDDPRQPILSHPVFSDIVLDWCLRQLSSHFNPKWNAA